MGSIMVVEDENLVSLHIRKTLEIKGYDVTAVATSGEEAVIKAGETHPDLVLMDIRLKGEMDGIEAAGKIRETMDIPIIYLTAYADKATVDRAKSTGAHGYIIKPFQEQDLYSSVEIALVKHQMERKIKESESSYRALSEQMPDALFLLELEDPEIPAKIIEVNDTSLRMHGYRRDELIGQSISILDDPETAKKVSDHIKELVEKRSVTFEGGHLRKDRSTFPVEVTAKMITLKGRDVALCIDRDISERKCAEEALNESHERLLSVLNSIDAGVYVADMETYEVLYLNKYMEEKFGNVTGQKCWKVFQSGQSGPCDFCTNDKLLTPEGNPAGVYDWEFQNRANSKWYHLRDRAIKWVDGRTVRLKFVTDITERKELKNELERNLEALANSNKTWVDTFDAISDPLFTCDKELRIIKANRAYLEEAGLLFREMIGKKYWEVFPRMDGPFSCCEMPDQEPCTWEDRDFVDEATKKVFRVRVFSITGLEGEPDYSLYTLENVTELKKAQEMLIQSAKLASIGELSSNIAHEINNPMTAVLGFASYILEEIGEASPYYEDLKAVEGEALRVRGIVRNLLDFARQRKLRKDEADINMVLSEALTLVTHMAEIAHIKIETELGEEMPDIMIDVNQIKQVFVNLVNNACHAMEGGGVLQMRTEMKKDEGGKENQIHISFKDTGCGIPQEIMKNIFNPFYTTKGEKGTGLGLSVSYGIVKNHNGCIIIKSEVGQGSEFIVMLPCIEGGSHG